MSRTRKHANDAARKRYHKQQKAKEPTSFVAIDGEGVTQHGIHYYTLLAASDGSSISNPEGLATTTCLDYLIGLKQQYPKCAFVSFYFSYDVNMMLKDLPPISVTELAKEGECRVRDSSTDTSYRITYIPGKFFTVSAYKHGFEKREHLGTIKIWDTFGFFQGSFLKALHLYKIGTTAELQVIERMKAKRDTFDSKEEDRIRSYNTLECDLLVRLMSKLDECLLTIDLKLTSWLGAGGIAAKLMQKHEIKNHLREPEDTHILPVRSAYFGGRIQAVQLGEFEGVYAHDVVSAYPSVIAKLPSLAERVQYLTSKYDGNPLVVYRIQWELPDSIPFTPFPFRERDGTIHYPLRGEGYYWSAEVEAALQFYPNDIKIIQGYGFYTQDVFPFGFVYDLFEARKQFKREQNHTQLVIKLGLNSLYGKTAQTVGYKNTRPPYQSFIYAGLITANTRAMLFTAAMKEPDKIIAFCTDGIYSTARLPKLSEGEDLGQWEVEQYDTFFIVKPGFYQAISGDKETATTRGFRRSTIDFDLLRKEWQANGIAGNLTVEDSHFIGMKAARSDPSKWRTWVTGPRTLCFWPSRDCPSQVSSTPCVFRMIPPDCCEGISLPYKWRELGENLDLETEIID